MLADGLKHPTTANAPSCMLINSQMTCRSPPQSPRRPLEGADKLGSNPSPIKVPCRRTGFVDGVNEQHHLDAEMPLTRPRNNCDEKDSACTSPG